MERWPIAKTEAELEVKNALPSLKVNRVHKVKFHPIKPQVLLAGGKQSKDGGSQGGGAYGY